MKIQILYIDDEVNNLTSFKANFREHFAVYTAESAEQGRKILKEKEINIIITDQRMPNTTGIEFLESIIPEYPDPVRILLTAYSDIETVIEAINLGEVYRYILKPFNANELKIIIENAYEVYAFKERNKKLLTQYKNIFEETKDVIFLVNKNGLLIDFNNAASVILKYSRNQLYTIDFHELLVDTNVEELIKKLKKDGAIQNMDIKLKDKKNKRIDALISVNPINGNSEESGYFGLIKDITKQKEANNSLLRALIDKQETDRDKFASALHDSLAQQLAGIKFYLQTITHGNTRSFPKEKIRNTVIKSTNAMDNVFTELRQICYDLMPRTLIEFGLIAAMHDLCNNRMLSNGLKFKITINDSFPNLDKTLQILIYRIIQEFIDNSIVHGKATEISINLNSYDNKVMLLLEDNGVGFKISNMDQSKGLGIKYIRSQVESYNGTLTIDSVINKGTSYKIEMPI
ncbi:MAG: response regulator [Bacteroidetes bacterium]|nr:response regulator [Bacteroidota bacterium]